MLDPSHGRLTVNGAVGDGAAQQAIAEGDRTSVRVGGLERDVL